MLKEFKAKYLDANSATGMNGDVFPSNDAAPATPKKVTPAKAAAGKGTPASRKRGKKAVKEVGAGGDDAAKNGLALASPTKKVKTTANKEEGAIKTEVKAEKEPEVAEDANMVEA